MKRGITLIELVVVLAVLGILTAIAIPTGVGAAKNGHAQICRQTIAALEAQHETRLALLPQASPAAEMDRLAVQNGGTVVDRGTRYSGLCPDDGTYSVTYDKNGKPAFTCSIDGHGAHP